MGDEQPQTDHQDERKDVAIKTGRNPLKPLQRRQQDARTIAEPEDLPRQPCEWLWNDPVDVQQDGHGEPDRHTKEHTALAVAPTIGVADDQPKGGEQEESGKEPIAAVLRAHQEQCSRSRQPKGHAQEPSIDQASVKLAPGTPWHDPVYLGDLIRVEDLKCQMIAFGGQSVWL